MVTLLWILFCKHVSAYSQGSDSYLRAFWATAHSEHTKTQPVRPGVVLRLEVPIARAESASRVASSRFSPDNGRTRRVPDGCVRAVYCRATVSSVDSSVAAARVYIFPRWQAYRIQFTARI
jgi:hypothetical protein